MSTKIKLNGDWIDVANNSISDSIRNPDWSRAIAVTSAQINAGYTVPDDGIMTFPYILPHPQGTTQTVQMFINDIPVSTSYTTSGADQRPSTLCLPVSKGDVIRLNSGGAIGETSNHFVPYKIAVAEHVYIGEKISGTKLTPTITTLSDTTTKIGEITLTKGKWLVYVNSWTPIALESTEWAMVVFGGVTVNVVPGLNAMIPLETYISVNSTTTYDLDIRTMLASPKTVARDYVFYAVRIG